MMYWRLGRVVNKRQRKKAKFQSAVDALFDVLHPHFAAMTDAEWRENMRRGHSGRVLGNKLRRVGGPARRRAQNKIRREEIAEQNLCGQGAPESIRVML